MEVSRSNSAQNVIQPLRLLSRVQAKTQAIWQRCKEFMVDAWKHASIPEILTFAACIISIPVIAALQLWPALILTLPALVCAAGTVLRKMSNTKACEAAMLEVKNSMHDVVNNLNLYRPENILSKLQEDRQNIIQKITNSQISKKDLIIDQVGRLEIGTITLKEFRDFIQDVKKYEQKREDLQALEESLEKSPYSVEEYRPLDQEKTKLFLEINAFALRLQIWEEQKNFPALRSHLFMDSRNSDSTPSQRQYFSQLATLLEEIIEKREDALRHLEDWDQLLVDGKYQEALNQRIDNIYEGRNAPLAQ